MRHAKVMHMLSERTAFWRNRSPVCYIRQTGSITIHCWVPDVSHYSNSTCRLNRERWLVSFSWEFISMQFICAPSLSRFPAIFYEFFKMLPEVGTRIVFGRRTFTIVCRYMAWIDYYTPAARFSELGAANPKHLNFMSVETCKFAALISSPSFL